MAGFLEVFYNNTEEAISSKPIKNLADIHLFKGEVQKFPDVQSLHQELKFVVFKTVSQNIFDLSLLV